VQRLYVWLALTILARYWPENCYCLALLLRAYPVRTSENLRPRLEGTRIILVGAPQSETQLQLNSVSAVRTGKQENKNIFNKVMQIKTPNKNT
jgi:hypothetical protein